MGYTKVILKENIEGVGKALDICDVKRGHATNLLLPQGLAVLATEAEIRKVAVIVKKQAELEDALHKNAKDIVKAVDGKTITFEAKTSTKGKLYGSITEKDISDELKETLKVEIPYKAISMKNGHIKHVGTFDIKLELSGDDNATIKVEVKESK